MILIVLFIGTILLVAALRNTYGALFSDLGQDVPKFITWAAAILALGAIGFVPGLKPISRGLMALVLLVIVFQNYSDILKGFGAVSKAPAATTSTSNTTQVTPQNQSYVPDYLTLDEMTPGSAFSTASIGH